MTDSAVAAARSRPPRTSRTLREWAVIALPILIQVADRQTTITYTDLAHRLDDYAVNGVHDVLNYLWWYALMPMDLPQLWSLVVSSDGFSLAGNATWNTVTIGRTDMGRVPVAQRDLLKSYMARAHSFPWQLVRAEIITRLEASGTRNAN